MRTFPQIFQLAEANFEINKPLRHDKGGVSRNKTLKLQYLYSPLSDQTKIDLKFDGVLRGFKKAKITLNGECIKNCLMFNKAHTKSTLSAGKILKKFFRTLEYSKRLDSDLECLEIKNREVFGEKKTSKENI